MNENFKYRVEIYKGEVFIENEKYKYIKDRKLFYNENQAKLYFQELLNSKEKGEKLRFYKKINRKWEIIEEV